MSKTAQSLFGSSRLQDHVTAIVDELVSVQKNITGVRPPQPELEQGYKAYIEKLNVNRGRNIHYNYVGSGLGQGPYVELDDGSVKFDLINGIGIHLFGHSHPDIIKTCIKASMQDIIMQGNLQGNREYGDILETLVKAASRTSKLTRGWITTCGTIANENALKIVRQKNTPARKILAMRDNFAGRSTLMAEITDNPEYRVGLPVYNEVLYLPFYDKNDPSSTEKTVAALKKHIAENPKNIACFMTELVQGEGGFNTAPAEFFKPLFEICKQHHIAVWADEIQTFARTGELFAFETLGLGQYIDIVTIAKTIQCGAVLYTEEYNPKPGLIAGTFTSSTVSMAAGNKILHMLLDGYDGQKVLGREGRVEKVHKEFISMIDGLKTGSCKGLIQDVGGIGLMIAMTPYDGSKEKTAKLLQVLFKNGIIAFGCGHGPYKVRFLVPLVIEKKHLTEIGGILEKSLKEAAVT